MEIEIGGRLIGRDHPPLLVAEISANHGGSLDKALELIDIAKQHGAEAVKFQTYTPDTLTIDCDKPAFYHSQESLWKGMTLYELYQKAHTPYAWHPTLFAKAKEVGLIPFSTPFDTTAVDLLESLDTPCYKIASLELTDHTLLKKCAKTQKPMLLSLGCASLEEIEEAVAVIQDTGNSNIALLKCTSAYPSPLPEANLATLQDLEAKFQTVIGLSDHTTTHLTSMLSVGLGASLIEKHFTLSRHNALIDGPFSVEPHEFLGLAKVIKEAFLARGVVHYGPTLHEKESNRMRRSLMCVQTIQPGQKLTETNVRSIRPGLGLPPKYYETVLGKTAKVLIERGDPITWENIS